MNFTLWNGFVIELIDKEKPHERYRVLGYDSESADPTEAGFCLYRTSDGEIVWRTSSEVKVDVMVEHDSEVEDVANAKLARECMNAMRSYFDSMRSKATE